MSMFQRSINYTYRGNNN